MGLTNNSYRLYLSINYLAAEMILF